MDTLVREVRQPPPPESLVQAISGSPGVVLLRSSLVDPHHGRFSFVTADPFLRFRSRGTRCETLQGGHTAQCSGNPWEILESLMAKFAQPEASDLPVPFGGCFGFWGYGLGTFIEPRVRRRAVDDLGLPDCDLGFHESVVAFDHQHDRAWIISTGLATDGSRSAGRARERLASWMSRFESAAVSGLEPRLGHAVSPQRESRVVSTFTEEGFIAAVEKARRYIRAGDIYQVNLAQRFTAPWEGSAWNLYTRLAGISPAPHAALLDGMEMQIVSSSPELFLRMSDCDILTRPIKGTRPRSMEPTRDAQLSYELQTSPKEMAELVMITDLLRNDLGRVCEYGSVQVPDLVRLERFAQVQHLVSTVTGRLRPGISHLRALAACFPGGSITGAPKVRAMEIIEELEPVARGPYTGALGYLGFNRESQLSIIIRTAIVKSGAAHFAAGAGIVADSDPEAEYRETLAKAEGSFRALAGGFGLDATSNRCETRIDPPGGAGTASPG